MAALGIATALLALGYTSSGLGATVTVQVGGGGLVFTPATTNISVNDSVFWNWVGSFHSTTSGTTSGTTATPDGLWDSSVNNAPHSFTHTFNSVGTFPYYCSIHFASGMKGSIIVSAPNNPPSVTITNPANGTTLSAPASFTLAASATDSDGTVTNVQFFQDGNSLGNVTTSPFATPVSNVTAADHTFSAIATDNGGLTATNSILVHVINASPIVVSAPVFPTPFSFQFSYTADVGLNYFVQVSSNLLNWTSLTTNKAAASPVTFTDTNSIESDAFYRVGLVPNP